MELERGIRRVMAPNPSPMTYHGTCTYLVGQADVAVIDPGPEDARHLDAILKSAGTAPIRAILVTHSHKDHSPLARPLSDATGAPIYGAGPSDWGKSEVMRRLSADGSLGGGEGVDAEFAPDEQLREGCRVTGADWTLEVLETPGHMANHLSFVAGDALFSGDLVMGWATSLVSPPDGDMTAFYASLDKLAARRDRVYYPGHGEPVFDPLDRVKDLAAHRRAREAAILAQLSQGAATAQALARAIYTDIAADLLPMAERNVLAHLIDLAGRNMIACGGAITKNSQFSRL